MREKHEWEDERGGYAGRRYTVTEAVATFADAGPPVMLTNHRPLRREILRLAGRVEELEGEHREAWMALRSLAAEWMTPEECPGEDLGESLGTIGIAAAAEECRLQKQICALGAVVRQSDAEVSLLRRERALLVDLEKARAAIIHGLLFGAVPASTVEDVARLNAAIEALHLEASGGIERPPGSACACILCRSEDDQKQVRQEVQLAGSPGQETCTACGEERETFEGRCHDCISSRRRGEGD